ncbi:hypothetical protein BT63DRAFT_99472 [Microthyrium microscopicum]|uniref:Uncharacterized protein n=1 Tax=Microthyrium microscopicum TaxID=703497 RepID=A0A6A6TW48_9PEZI|nr:hypothetical protein BT63DRAFT_99472 [Microthyrium microscopicum]
MVAPLNLFVSTFPGLNLPSTINVQVPRTISLEDALSAIQQRLPAGLLSQLIVSTTSGRQLKANPEIPISSLLTDTDDTFLNLRLHTTLCGGKGGFGSQLRAAGGRMSSRKKKNQGEQNGSSRNLDGRRLRTVTEAKALAEYLAVKPDMDAKEKEERRKRWQQVVEMAEKKTDELQAGGKARLDGKWMEDKEEASEKTREAVLASLSAGEIRDVLMGSDGSGSGSEDEEASDEENEAEVKLSQKGESSSKPQARAFFGWEEEDLSESDESAAEEESKDKKQSIVA